MFQSLLKTSIVVLGACASFIYLGKEAIDRLAPRSATIELGKQVATAPQEPIAVSPAIPVTLVSEVMTTEPAQSDEATPGARASEKMVIQLARELAEISYDGAKNPYTKILGLMAILTLAVIKFEPVRRKIATGLKVRRAKQELDRFESNQKLVAAHAGRGAKQLPPARSQA